jgi:hypothetical protein
MRRSDINMPPIEVQSEIKLAESPNDFFWRLEARSPVTMQCLRRASSLRSLEALSRRPLLKSPSFYKLLQTRHKGEYRPVLEQKSDGDDPFELKSPGLKPIFTPSPIFDIIEGEKEDKEEQVEKTDIPKPRKPKSLKDSEKTVSPIVHFRLLTK